MAEGTVVEPVAPAVVVAPLVVKPVVVAPVVVPVKPLKKVSSLAEKEAALKSVK